MATQSPTNQSDLHTLGIHVYLHSLTI